MGKCLRICFGIINFLVFVGGCVLLGLAVWLHVDPASLYSFVDLTKEAINNTKTSVDFEDMLTYVDASLYFAMAVGAFMVLVGFLGCAGAAFKNSCLLNTFAAIMILLILAEIAVTILSFVKYPIFSEFMQKRFDGYEMDQTNLLNAQSQVNPDEAFNNEFVDILQKNLVCCDWTEQNATATQYPLSCCQTPKTPNDAVLLECTDPHTSTCESVVKKAGLIIGGIAAGCLVLEVLATVCACCITRKARKEYG